MTRRGSVLAWGALLGVIGGFGLAESIIGLGSVVDAGDLGADFVFYRDVGGRWLADGSLYRPHQLSGEPYQVRIQESVLYPPAAIVLFVPFVWLPAILWWVIPVGLLAYVVWGFRPSRWGWVAIAAMCLWPPLQRAVLFGNTDMWAAAGVAAGIRWGWPAALIALKPVFLPLALVGIRNPSTWLVGFSLLVLSLPLLPDYVTAMRTARFSPDYSLGSVVFVLLPLVSFAVGERRSREDEPST